MKGSYILLVELAAGKDILIQIQSIPGFGSSDYKCQNHLYFAKEEDRLKAKVAEAVRQAGLAHEIFF